MSQMQQKTRSEFQVKFECRKALSRMAMNRQVNKFGTTGSMIDNKKGDAGKKKSVITSENIHCIEQVLAECLRKSVKPPSQQFNF
jgi:hypothetical protein